MMKVDLPLKDAWPINIHIEKEKYINIFNQLK